MNILSAFKDLEDPRKDINRKHDFLDVIFLFVSAVISGAEGWSEIHQFGKLNIKWLRKYRDFENGIPVDDTIARIVRRINPEKLNYIFINFINEIRKSQGKECIAIDGKTLKNSSHLEPHNALHSITAWSCSRGLILAQNKSKGKKNENESILEMIDILELNQAVITVDAMNTQKKIAKKIIEKKSDYVMPLKNNHKKFRNEIESYFHKVVREKSIKIDKFQEVNCERSRIDQRYYSKLPISDWLLESQGWTGIKSLIQVHRIREDNGKKSEEKVFYISSLDVPCEDFAKYIRGHWEVENKAHWVLDVVFKEDDSTIYLGDGVENMAIIRRLGLNLARLHPAKNSMKSKLKSAGWSDEMRSELIFGVCD
ncbi:ISAs1 family transposase [Phocoenobacter atlanticus subsp. cyclopteri]|uniref:ISAs1 family transposase n=2 Tax=Phocoenobacter atlanticus TaxID=3416742 RepID=UPI001BC999FD|nr:ISAs1 family transposase [Pasteurella atlantica]QVE21403.1 ISAs1 family transposase [Pasteurella atlantica]QVE21796.1 ISAs1 family transposase [Pasteurella atlantica]